MANNVQETDEPAEATIRNAQHGDDGGEDTGQPSTSQSQETKANKRRRRHLHGEPNTDMVNHTAPAAAAAAANDGDSPDEHHHPNHQASYQVVPTTTIPPPPPPPPNNNNNTQQITANNNNNNNSSSFYSSSLLSDGLPSFLCGPDIALRRRVDTMLTKRPYSIVVSDSLEPDNPIIFVNRRFEQITGYFAIEILGRNCRFLQYRGPYAAAKHNDVSSAAVSSMRRAVETGEELQVELLNFAKDGRPLKTHLHLLPVHGDSHAPHLVTHMVGMQTFEELVNLDLGKLPPQPPALLRDHRIGFTGSRTVDVYPDPPPASSSGDDDDSSEEDAQPRHLFALPPPQHAIPPIPQTPVAAAASPSIAYNNRAAEAPSVSAAAAATQQQQPAAAAAAPTRTPTITTTTITAMPPTHHHHHHHQQQQQQQPAPATTITTTTAAAAPPPSSSSASNVLLPFDRLDDEAALLILSLLDPQSLAKTAMVSRRMRALCDCDRLWQAVFARALGSKATMSLAGPARTLGWRTVTRQVITLEALHWRRRRVDGAVMPARCNFSACAVGMAIVIFGGEGQDTTPLGDVYLLDMAAPNPCWERVITPTDMPSPPGRWGHTLRHLRGSLLVLYGGCGSDGPLTDVWLLDISGGAPRCRRAPRHHRFATAGIHRGDGSGSSSGHSSSPSNENGNGSDGGGSGSDGGNGSDRGGRAARRGGDSSTPPDNGNHLAAQTRRRQGRWIRVDTGDIAPPRRSWHASCAIHGRSLVVFGGCGIDGNLLNDTWVLDIGAIPRDDTSDPAVGMLANVSPPVCHSTWREIEAAWKPPSRLGHSMIVLEDGKLLLFGGLATIGPVRLRSSEAFTIDLEETHKPTWRFVTGSTLPSGATAPGTPPPPRLEHVACRLGDCRVLVFGGSVMPLSGSAGAAQTAAAAPAVPTSPSTAGAAASPPGATTIAATGNAASGVFVLDARAAQPHWRQLAVAGLGPAYAWGHSAVLLGGASIVVIGGYAGEDWLLNDVNELHLTSTVDGDDDVIAAAAAAGAGAGVPAAAVVPAIEPQHANNPQIPAVAAVSVMMADARSWANAALGFRGVQQRE
eukprot:CAMPEP_0119191264 /NCGR_PEP_ID=MMETSP1316-20130426/2111_1 /TAXON_ID=41880 /ORGANISM="Pycnococcus provasolii, Strain RCC2336" /LENGTH=1079 /DNA_ID=CAMNT_0007186267 /DNA_START=402 /DNA_END=3641 /DNA_ORIENTATION=+